MAVYVGGLDIEFKRMAPVLRSAPSRTNRMYPIGTGAAPPLSARLPERRITSLLCGAGAPGAHRLTPFDCTWYQREYELARPSTEHWLIGRPAVGLEAGDSRGLTSPRANELPAPAWLATPPTSVRKSLPPRPRLAPRGGPVTVEEL